MKEIGKEAAENINSFLKSKGIERRIKKSFKVSDNSSYIVLANYWKQGDELKNLSLGYHSINCEYWITKKQNGVFSIWVIIGVKDAKKNVVLAKNNIFWESYDNGKTFQII